MERWSKGEKKRAEEEQRASQYSDLTGINFLCGERVPRTGRSKHCKREGKSSASQNCCFTVEVYFNILTGVN